MWDRSRWRRKAPKAAAIAAHHHQVRCAAGPGNKAAIEKRWRADRRAFYRHRHAMLELEAVAPNICAPGIRSAIPCYIPACESGYSFTARNEESTAGGFYQILESTWYSYGGRRYSDAYPAAVAPPLEQHRIAAAIWADVGASAWVCG